MHFRQILKSLSKSHDGKGLIKKILFKNKHRLSLEDFCLLEYTFFEKLSVYNICDKLILTEPTYYNHLKNAVCKFEGLISDDEYREIIKLL